MSGSRQLAVRFGPLEIGVLEALWRSGTPAAVRDILPQFPGTAYTTLMTTMDRLFHKGVLSRQKVSRAFVYQPRFSQHEQILDIAASAFDDVMPEQRDEAAAILARFVDVVASRDHALLEELEELVRQRRASLQPKPGEHS
jgi:predicted transcriptional regulator